MFEDTQYFDLCKAWFAINTSERKQRLIEYQHANGESSGRDIDSELRA